MEKSYLEKEPRKDILKEIENCIGYVYAEYYNNNDKLIVKEFDYTMSYGRRGYKDLKKGYSYFDMFHLIKKMVRIPLRQAYGTFVMYFDYKCAVCYCF